MTNILMLCEEQLFADGVFAALMTADLPDTINFLHLSPQKQMHTAVNLQAVDIIIYVSSGLRRDTISLINKIRRQNPEVRQINVISDLDTVVRTDPRIEYMHRNNRFEVMEEMVRTFMQQLNKASHLRTPAPRTKHARGNATNAIVANLSRLQDLDTFYEQNNRAAYTSLYRDILEVAFNQARRTPYAYDIARRMVAAYLHTFRARYALDLHGVDDDFFSILDTPRPTEKQIARVFMRLSDVIFSSPPDLDEAAAVTKAKAYIAQNLLSDLTLTSIAEAIELNPSYLSRVFSQTQGESLGAYIARLKTDSAKGMLRDTDMSVSKIASKLGFRSANYFIRFFKKHTGLPPQMYRENQR